MVKLKKYILWLGLLIFAFAACSYWWTGISWQSIPDKESLQVVQGHLINIKNTDRHRSSAPDNHPKSFITLEINRGVETYTLFFLKALGDYESCGPRLKKGNQKLNTLPKGTLMEFLTENENIWQIKAGDEILMTYDDLREYSKIKGETTFLYGFYYFFALIGLTFYYWRKGELL